MTEDRDEERLKLDYPTFEDAVRAVGRAGPLLRKEREPNFPESIQIEPYNDDGALPGVSRYRITLDGKTWDVEVVKVGVYYSPRLPGRDVLAPDKPRLYASREFALSAAVRYIK